LWQVIFDGATLPSLNAALTMAQIRGAGASR
jgi:hypothetical protein